MGAGPSGIMATDAIVKDSVALHVAGVPIVNPSTVVSYVTPGFGNGFQATPKTSTTIQIHKVYGSSYRLPSANTW